MDMISCCKVASQNCWRGHQEFTAFSPVEDLHSAHKVFERESCFVAFERHHLFGAGAGGMEKGY